MSPFELPYGRAFLRSDLRIDEAILQMLSYTNLGQVQKALQEYRNKILPAFDKDYQRKQVNPKDMEGQLSWVPTTTQITRPTKGPSKHLQYSETHEIAS